MAMDDSPVENVAQLRWIIGESADSLISGSDLLNQDPILVGWSLELGCRSRCEWM